MNLINRLPHFKNLKWTISLCFIVCVTFVSNAQPEPPKAFHIVSLDEANELSWQATVSPGVSEYRIYRSTDSVTFSPLANVPFGTNTYTDNGLINGQFYFYAITAFDGTEGDFSTVDASTPEDNFSSFIRFDGAGYGVVSDSLYLSLDKSDRRFSIELWVRINDISKANQTILMRESAYGGKTVYYTIKYTNGGFSAYVYTSNQAVATNPATFTINENQWYHLTFTGGDAANVYHLYVDGQEVSSRTYSLPFENQYARLFVGGETSTKNDATGTYTVNNYMAGDICELRLWNKFRSEAEVQADLYSRLRGDEDTRLYGVWHFDREFNGYTYNYGIAELNTANSPSAPFEPQYENIKLFGDAHEVSPEIDVVDDAVNVHTNAVDDVLNVQNNDVFNENYVLPSVIVTPPKHGTAEISDRTDILYTPVPGYLGKDSIQYLVVDSTFFLEPYRFADTAWVYIDVYNNPPVITSNGGGDNASISINENTTAVTTVTATDADAGATLTYSIAGGADQARFNMNSSNGVLVFDPAPDFENPTDNDTDNVYVVIVNVSDGVHTDQQTLTVTVNDVIEAATFTIDPIADANVDENVAYTSVTPSITGTPIGSITYSISGGADAAAFTINAATGVVSMVARNFESPDDANTDNVYELEITVTDADGNDASESWTVTVNDVSEAATFTIDPIADANVNENVAYTSVTPSITGTPIGGITYAISGGADAGAFTINAATGVVSMVARDFESPDDANTDNVYELEITVTDADGNDASESWTVTVNDVIEAATFTIDPIADANVDENVAYTSVTPSITGTPIGSITYSISGGADAGAFTINAATGVVSMVARNFESPDDANTDNVYELEITVTDADGNDASESWTVTVNDVIEAATFSINPIADANVDENVAYTSVTPSITGTPIGGITYAISGGADAGAFTINAATGVVSMVARNFESPDDANADNVYEIEITVTDADGNDASESWTVTVNDVIEAATFSINPIADANVDENVAYTSVTPLITGTPIGGITYAISGGADAGAFTINAATGVVSMVARNFESPDDANTDNVYELEITVTDADGNNASESWTVTVNDVSEAATFTIDPIADANVNENVAYTSVTPSITGTPIGGITYAISGGADAAAFTINAATGVVSMVARNFESPDDANTDNVYELEITVTDADGNDTSESWMVTVNDVMEAATFTIDPIADTNVDENVAYTSVTPSIIGTPIGGITYAISGGADAGTFTINAATGVVSMVARDFESPDDANADNVYELEITVTDADGNDASESWTVTVNDVIEAATFTIDPIADANVDENVAYTSVTPSITGTPIGGITYAISGGADAAAFTINSTTGVVSMVARNFESPDDANADNVYEIEVTVTDADGNDASENWTVTVNDVIEAATFTIDPIADANVNENAAYTSVTPSISGIPIGSITYTISGGADAAAFTINATTGVVSMVARNFESPDDANADNVYEIEVTVTDADGNDASESWTVTVNDVIEAATFTIDPIADANVNENAAYTSVTPSISGIPIGSITYTISGGADAAAFTINATTGVVSMVARDFESPDDANSDNVYELEITVTDADGNDASENWTVAVNNMSETAAFTIAPIADANVDENVVYTSTIPSIIGTPIGGITYAISGGADAANFTINATTGVVGMVARNFESPDDANVDNIYELEITVTDADGNDASESWTVTVNDVIEAATFTIDPIADTNINENVAYTSVTPSIIGTPIGGTTYTISGGSDASAFTINATTGVVNMVARNFESPDDANTDNIYELEITVTDADGNDASESWTVTVNDVIEAATFTIDPIADANVDENAVYTSVTPSITGTPIGNVTYAISGGADASAFTINAATGAVSMVGRNFESPDDANTDNIYELEITVTDADGNNASESWTVTVNDVIEAATFSIDPIGDDTVNENAAYTLAPPPSITGTPIGSVTFSISGGADASAFTINPVGVVVMVPKNFESPEDNNGDNAYEIEITATDTDGNSDSESWRVSVIDLNDNAPVITSNGGGDNASINVNEQTTAVTTVTATDADTSSNLTFSITGGEDQALFTIDGNSGNLTFISPPDFANPTDDDLDNIYEVIVAVSDGTFTDEQFLGVTVIEVNAPPVSLSLSQNTVVENQPIGILVGTFSTGDSNDTHTYTIEGGADAASFSINGDELITAESFNFESKVNYEILVRTTDTGGGFLERTFQIVILDANDAPSSISLSNNTVLEKQPAGTLVGVLSTADEDVNDVHHYDIIDGPDASLFSIQDNQLLTNASFDYDLRNSFRIVIRSTDSGDAFVEEDFEIIVIPDPEHELNIPSAFTPDNDGFNDVWEIPEIERYPNCKVTIMHRNGREVFYSEGYQRQWDGTNGNKTLGKDTYFYIIELNDSSKRVYKGFVMIL